MNKQLTLNLYKGTHGGRRPNCGKKRKHSPGVAHSPREKVTPHTPLHINFKYNTYIKSDQVFEIFVIALRNAKQNGMRINHYSMQSNHIHLIAEVQDNTILERSMRSLTNTMVKRINLLKKISGSIQIERYHLHVLRTPKEVRNAIKYVLFNELHHSGTQRPSQFSSIYGFVELDQPMSWLGKKSLLH